MKKGKSILSLVLAGILIALMGFAVLVGFGKTGTGAMKNIKLGLDLAGGVSITYQVKDDNPTDEEMSDTIYKLQKRVEQYSNESSVYQEGKDRINIEIPGVTDANAILDELGIEGIKDALTVEDILKNINTAEEIRELVKNILDSVIIEKAQRLVIFIDELDRCRPSYAIEMLERINSAH